ncbi:hypothetical protein BY996DRAFT_7313135 [Phakopsora pachyrhizi]|uniref:C3H1-type domain-containing protein n=1 Tax=Phakopsora pachyrhizi TaxID=170000 RepID=A0AAV0APR6_PHAPC|nr:hypothetical protein BY996DRAFT_7313135 [Phakopsora pachyrhizi]CAH7670869.1 hypothetical protein PPACK8108_LOCUS5613 [Phakopsora pachyrhizi]
MMASPEIVMQTPAAKQLELAVQRKLAEFSYSTADDVVMAEYVVVMLANSKTPDQITAELTELIGDDMYDPAFTTWLFEEVRRQYGLPLSAESATQSPSEPAEQPSQLAPNLNEEREFVGKIETVDDSRDVQSARRGPIKRLSSGPNPVRTSHGVFNQAVGGMKRPGASDINRDSPPHRRLRAEDQFSNGSIPTGPRSMDRNMRDSNRQNNHATYPGSVNSASRRDVNNVHLPNPGLVLGAESAGKSILERVGMINNTGVMNNGARTFHNLGFQGGYDGRTQQGNSQFRRNNDQQRDNASNGRLPVPPSSQPVFYGMPPYQAPLMQNNPNFPHQPFLPQNIMNSTTPQLFLANGQPFIPSQAFQIPGSTNGILHPVMYSHPMFSPALNGSATTTPQNTTLNSQSKTEKPASVGVTPSQPSEADLSSLPSKPLLRQECKYNLLCKNAWCPSSHCAPKGNTKSSLLLSFDPCEKQLLCVDPDCSKAHVSPQQLDPKASIKLPTSSKSTNVAPAVAAPTYAHAFSSPQATNLTPCRFGINCARPDCVFSHPWKMKVLSATSEAETSKNAFSAIPCKFGTACARPACHFQHPFATPVSSAHRVPSKNITKTFNNGTDASPSGALGSLNPEKLTPSKKFSPAESLSTNKQSVLGTKTTKKESIEKNDQLLSNRSLSSGAVSSAAVMNAATAIVS